MDDSSFTVRSTLAPDPQLRWRFEAARADAEALARPVLATDPHDHDALFALAMVYGRRADYAALIEGHNMAFLSNARKARDLLVALARDFPSDALFAREIRRLDGRGR